MDKVVTKLNLSQAARVTGKSRMTLYRHIESGKLSAEKDATDNTCIDLSELQRVYGALDMSQLDKTSSQLSQNYVQLQSATPSIDTEDVLKTQLLHMEELLDIERERRYAIEKQLSDSKVNESKLIEIIEKQNLALTAPQEPRGFFQRIFSRV